MIRVRLAALLLGSAALAACAPIVDNRGNLPDPDALKEVRVGVHGRADIVQLLGSPSTAGTFDDKTWYYVARRTETTAFLAPRLVDQKVVIVRFDDAGTVRAVETRGLESAQNVEHSDRETPTLGQQLTFFDQLFGTLGRYNNAKDGKGN